MACTLRIASSNAKFGLPELGLGVIPGWGGTQRLPRLVGEGRALELLITGRSIGAEEAYQIGLINKVAPPEGLMDACMELAATIIKKAPIAVSLAIRSVKMGSETSSNIGRMIESSLEVICFGTEDSREGINAFLEKRPPRFKGK